MKNWNLFKKILRLLRRNEYIKVAGNKRTVSKLASSASKANVDYIFASWSIIFSNCSFISSHSHQLSTIPVWIIPHINNHLKPCLNQCVIFIRNAAKNEFTFAFWVSIEKIKIGFCISPCLYLSLSLFHHSNHIIFLEWLYKFYFTAIFTISDRRRVYKCMSVCSSIVCVVSI